MDTNRVPGPRPAFNRFVGRQTYARNLRGAPAYDPARNARANNRSYHVEPACEAMHLTPPWSGERRTFKRWSRQ